MRKLITAAIATAIAGVAPAAASATHAESARPATAVHEHGAERAQAPSQKLASEIAKARVATARYATDLARARRDGYGIITRMIPDMGWHFMNPGITQFDVRKPPILVYVKRDRQWQLVAFEWVFPTKPKTPPLPGATYGSFAAACHYRDGTFEFRPSQEQCEPRSPETGAAFGFWHPDLVTLHVWAWYPNPDGLFNGTNSLVHPFNHG